MGVFNTSPFNTTPFNTPGTSVSTTRSLGIPVPINSTTYVDMLGILLGLQRIGGETSEQFVTRLYEASRSKRTGDYVGFLNQLHIHFGLKVQIAISLVSDIPFQITADISGVTIISGTNKFTSPLFTLDLDTFMLWRKLSDIVLDINTNGICKAALIGADGPALQIAKQTNTQFSIPETINGTSIFLANTGVVVGTELFSGSVPTYQYSQDNSKIIFSSPVASGTTVTYQYQTCPYNIVSAPISILSMMDPNLAQSVVTKDNQLAYQIQEIIQSIMSIDQSYWAK